ncbi:hypothetical protein B5V89_16350 [Heyndrickxia sporothermodurans]|uniref:hypothetical protein n=1 Tax=Heyndrickxia sporothermodurans TaxID=46224 RepID=UPI000D38E587|nr:hypothetical protein [Heyndrickxia sporothermodurans]PTY76971.1 hypothetical protein B5V89_16350 [Heyndrickxia sporothermodurans]
MNTIDYLNLKQDWTHVKERILTVANQLEGDDKYKKEDAVRELIKVVEYMDDNEPRAVYIDHH